MDKLISVSCYVTTAIDDLFGNRIYFTRDGDKILWLDLEIRLKGNDLYCPNTGFMTDSARDMTVHVMRYLFDLELKTYFTEVFNK